MAIDHTLRDSNGAPARLDGNPGNASDVHFFCAVSGDVVEMLMIQGGPSISDTSNDATILQAVSSVLFPGIWDITSWGQYRSALAAEDQGHQPWLLDPALVVQAWASGLGWWPTTAVHQVANDTFQVTKPGAGVVYTVRGTSPDPGSGPAVWVITSISHT
jgi:hypothetical protein